MKEVTMKKVRLISLIASLCLMAFGLQGVARGACHGDSAHLGGGGVSWFDGF
jgi:hypothetical protein